MTCDTFSVDDLVRCRLTQPVIDHGLAYRHGIIRAVWYQHADGTPRYDVEFPYLDDPKIREKMHPCHLMKDSLDEN